MYSHIILITGARTWNEAGLIERTFNNAWRTWGPPTVTRPLLVSGHADKGADRLAERAWTTKTAFEVKRFPADWKSHGVAAGPMRNQQMVDFLVSQREQSQLLCAAFIDLCATPDCPRRHEQQMMPSLEGHYSHGTMDCLERARAAAIPVIEVLEPRLPPF